MYVSFISRPYEVLRYKITQIFIFPHVNWEKKSSKDCQQAITALRMSR